MVKMDPQPVIEDQHVAARVYFLCVFAMFALEGLVNVPAYLAKIIHRGQPKVKSSTTRHWKLRVLVHKLFILPSPIPGLSRYNLPVYIRFTVFAALNILFGYNRVKYTTDYKLYGWLSLANGGLALLLGARTNLLGLVLRVPSPTLLAYHRLVGRAALLHATLHFAWTADHYARTDQLADVLTNQFIQAGVASWAASCILAITSIGFIRRRWFEAFYYPHAFFLVFVIGALIHAAPATEFILPGLCLWILDRFVRFVNNFRTLSVTSVAYYHGDVTKIKVHGLEERSHPGQIAFVQIPSISFFNWHPFTIASGPADATATFAIRGLGGYTKRVQQVANEVGTAGSAEDRAKDDNDQTHMVRHVGLKVRLDGPYGTSTLQYDQYPVIALVAGGIGITPGVSIASHIIHQATSLAANETATNQWHVHLLWVVKDIRQTSWFEQELKKLDTRALGSAGRVTFDVLIFVTGKSQVPAGHPYEEGSYAMEEPYTYTGPGAVVSGRPNLGQWFASLKLARPGMDAAVNLCGPRPLIDDARRAAARVSDADGLFHVEEEVFEF